MYRTSRLALVAALAGVAGAFAHPAAAAPTVTLVAPATNSTVTLKPGQYVTYSWQVAWPDAPAQGTVPSTWQLATDPSFSASSIVATDGESCSLPNYACWTSFTPPRVYGPPYGRTYYWRVQVNGVYSNVSFFRVELAPDHVKPRVQAYGGSARRGTTAHFTARVEDDRGEVRFRATLEWHGIPVLAHSFPFASTVWSAPLDFWSAKPLSRRLPAGRYEFCLTAWDRAGNRARSCAAYHVS